MSADRRTAWNSTLPARTSWMPRSAPRASRPRPAAATRTRRETGFSAAVKLACRTRAGNGDPREASCEACGIPLGLRGGQVQHIVARMMGGRGVKAPWWMSSVVDAALLCGTTYTGDHFAAETRDPKLGPDGIGVWLRSTDNPYLTPMWLHGLRPGTVGRQVWRTIDGGYADQAPDRDAS